MINPRISVVLPVYNGMRYLEESVESVLLQDFDGFELLIIDDASTDESFHFLEGLPDTRITLVRNEENKGLFFTLNRLVSMARAPFVKLWAQDDRMQPGCLSGFYDFHLQHHNLGMSYSAITYIDGVGNVIAKDRQDNTPAVISRDEHAIIAYSTGSIAGNISNVCIRRDTFQQVGLFNEAMRISADFDMWVRISEYFDIGFIKNPLVQVRDHPGQLSRDESLYRLHVEEDARVYHYLDSYVTPGIREKGKLLMRQNKLVFYFTMMLKLAARGKLRSACTYFKVISTLDNFWKVGRSFIQSKF